MVRMVVSGIHLDPSTGSAVLVLASEDDRVLPILIGMAEATSIAKELNELSLPRPLPHDLMRELLDTLEATVDQVEVVDLRDETYYAVIVIRDQARRQTRVDSRPSDAIALALRVDAPVFVHEQVLSKSRSHPQEFQAGADKERWKAILEAMEPEDFGKYKI